MTAAGVFPYTQALIVGGTGQTGHRVLQGLVERGVKHIVATSRLETGGRPAGPLASTVSDDVARWGAKVGWACLDFESAAERLSEQLGGLTSKLRPGEPTVLVIAAAFTNVEGCETDPAFCERVNERNTIATIEWARARFGAKIVFYSTDYVFDGAAGPYEETAPRRPISVYGRSKAAVEQWLETNAPDALVIRTTGVFDYLPGSKNFLMQMLTMWSEGKTARVPSDQLANPVAAPELARATLELVARGSAGVYHVAGGTQLARDEFARLIAQVFGHDAALVTSVATSALNQKAARPLKGGLVCEKLRRELGWAPAGARSAVEGFKKVSS